MPDLLFTPVPKNPKPGRPVRWILALLLLVLFAAALPASAQLFPTESKDDATESSAPDWEADSLDRNTPRGAVAGFIKAVAEENYDRAGRYLNLNRRMTATRQGPKLARALQRVLDKHGNLIPNTWVSDELAGHTDDNLGPNLDRVGTATLNGETFDLILEKTEGPQDEPIWLFSTQTLQRIPLSAEETGPSLSDRVVPELLQTKKWEGVPVSHWLAMLVLAVGAYAFVWAVTSLILFLFRLLWAKAKEEPTAGILKAFALPIQLYLSVWLLVAASQEVGISIIVRQWFSKLNVVVGLVALLLLLWRLIDVATRLSERRMARRGNVAGVSAILFLRRGAKVALVTFGIIGALGSLGLDVTTGLAALGIGGLALALGAQKTIENFVGSVTLIADQPIRVGDFCKVGETTGTVEQIGMRSTRLRTMDRTIVTIPNGDFSSQRIENYAHRDRFRFQPTLTLRFETTPDQIRYLLVQLRSLLYAHPKVDPEPARVRFVDIGGTSLNIEILAYVIANDFGEFLEIKEDLLLQIMDIVQESGTGFAFPSQTLYMARDTGVSKEKTQTAEEQVSAWRNNDELQLPRFQPERIESLKNTIPYPPKGAAGVPGNTA